MYINQIKLIQDLGTMCINENSTYKVRFGIYECPVCKVQFKTTTKSVNARKSSRCKKCANKANSTTHGEGKTRLYSAWLNMSQRVNNKKHRSYKDYGLRGIVICNEWKKYENFREWALNNGYADTLTIDRINVNGNYEPSNCRWTTTVVQARNTRKIRVDNTSNYRGVVKRTLRDGSFSFVAQIGIKGKRLNLGTYKCRLAAAYAYDEYVTKNNLEHTKNFD